MMKQILALVAAFAVLMHCTDNVELNESIVTGININTTSSGSLWTEYQHHVFIHKATIKHSGKSLQAGFVDDMTLVQFVVQKLKTKLDFTDSSILTFLQGIVQDEAFRTTNVMAYRAESIELFMGVIKKEEGDEIDSDKQAEFERGVFEAAFDKSGKLELGLRVFNNRIALSKDTVTLSDKDNPQLAGLMYTMKFSTTSTDNSDEKTEEAISFVLESPTKKPSTKIGYTLNFLKTPTSVDNVVDASGDRTALSENVNKDKKDIFSKIEELLKSKMVESATPARMISETFYAYYRGKFKKKSDELLNMLIEKSGDKTKSKTLAIKEGDDTQDALVNFHLDYQLNKTPITNAKVFQPIKKPKEDKETEETGEHKKPGEETGEKGDTGDKDKKKGSGAIIAIIVILLIVLVGVVGFAFWKSKQLNSKRDRLKNRRI